MNYVVGKTAFHKPNSSFKTEPGSPTTCFSAITEFDWKFPAATSLPSTKTSTAENFGYGHLNCSPLAKHSCLVGPSPLGHQHWAISLARAQSASFQDSFTRYWGWRCRARFVKW